MAVQTEDWNDGDIQGDFFRNSLSTIHTAFSSRHSLQSESNAGDEDWQLELTPEDKASTSKAISTAKEAGIPIPNNIPPSALLGGSIKRLGKKKSRQNIPDDWGDELGISDSANGTLTLKPSKPRLDAFGDGQDDFDEWAEGSLGIRFAGTRRELRNRSSSVSAMSPSMGSVKTFESEEDGLDGLVIPSGTLTFDRNTIKKQLQPDVRPLAKTPNYAPNALPQTPTRAGNAPKDDFFSDIEFGAGEVFDPKKRTLNRNIKQNPPKSKTPSSRPQTTLTFTEKPITTKIPRPISGSRPSRLEPVFEAGPAQTSRTRRPEPTTTGAQLLRSKRSMPALRNQTFSNVRSPAGPFANSAQQQPSSHRLSSKPSIPHFRRDSDTNRPLSPPVRSSSRLSATQVPDTPTRQRKDVAPAALVREANTKKNMTRPARRRNFGDGTELEIFDDLPTSAAKESKFLKQPSTRPAPKTLRNQPSLSKFPVREKMTTPLPGPRSPTRAENLPRFARDTAASRNAREQKLGNAKPPREGPLMPLRHVNWQAQVAARTPHTSPTAPRSNRNGPTLIRPMNTGDRPRTEKDMTWNPTLCTWEGNENILAAFDQPAAPPAPPSPPRPALITNISSTQGVQVVGGMVFDPRRMCWLKMGATASNPMSPSVDEDDDPFKDIDDLVDEATADKSSTTGTRGVAVASDWLVGEEFDLGPEFIRRQRDEEKLWRSKIGAWFGHEADPQDVAYKWAIRDLATTL